MEVIFNYVTATRSDIVSFSHIAMEQESSFGKPNSKDIIRHEQNHNHSYTLQSLVFNDCLSEKKNVIVLTLFKKQRTLSCLKEYFF